MSYGTPLIIKTMVTYSHHHYYTQSIRAGAGAGAEIGKERTKNRVSGSGTVSGGHGKRWSGSRSGARSGGVVERERSEERAQSWQCRTLIHYSTHFRHTMIKVT